MECNLEGAASAADSSATLTPLGPGSNSSSAAGRQPAAPSLRGGAARVPGCPRLQPASLHRCGAGATPPHCAQRSMELRTGIHWRPRSGIGCQCSRTGEGRNHSQVAACSQLSLPFHLYISTYPHLPAPTPLHASPNPACCCPSSMASARVGTAGGRAPWPLPSGRQRRQCPPPAPRYHRSIAGS